MFISLESELEKIPERVQLGIATLDAEGPENWRDKIDLDTLDISSAEVCALGQLYGNYHRAPKDLTRNAVTLGFAASLAKAFAKLYVYDEYFDSLTQEWKKELSAAA